MTQELNIFSVATINLVRKYNTAPSFLTSSIKIANRINNSGHPVLLKNISSIGISVSDYLPGATQGSITVDDKYDGIGFNRKFSDLFDEYSPINQTLNISVYSNDVDDLTIQAPNLKLNLNLKVLSYSVDLENQEVTLSVIGYQLPTQQFTREVLASDSFAFGSSDFYIPEQSIGKNIPLIMGENVYSKLIPMTDREIGFSPNSITGTSSTVGYAMSVNFDTFYTSNPTNFYLKQNGEYKEFATTSTVSTAVYDKTGLTLTADLTLNENVEKGTYVVLNTDTSNRYVITGGTIQLRGLSTYSGTVGGTVSINLYEEDPSATIKSAGKAPKKDPIARATIDKSDYAAQFKPGVSADFWLSFSFDKPVIAGDPSTFFYMGISHSDNGANTMTVKQGTDSSYNRFTRNSGGDWELGTSTNGFIVKFYPLGKADWSGTTDTDANGLDFKIIQLGQYPAGTGAVNPDITNLDILVKGDGLKDDVAGSVTGTPSSLIKYSHHQIHLLHHSFDGTSWGYPTYEPLQFNQSHSVLDDEAEYYHRRTSFVTSGRQLARDIIPEICRNAEIRLAPSILGTSKVGVWAYGKTETDVYDYTDDEIRGISYSALDSKSVVNVVRMSYSPNSLNKKIENYLYDKTDGSFTKNYNVVIIASSRSRVNYGNKVLANQLYPMINDDGSAYRVAQTILELNALPTELVTFEIALSDYLDYFGMISSFDIFNTISIQSPRLPNYYGTHVDPQLAYYNGVEGDVVGGSEVMAKKYRAQIEGFIFNLNEPLATMTITARLLLNEDEVT